MEQLLQIIEREDRDRLNDRTGGEFSFEDGQR